MSKSRGGAFGAGPSHRLVEIGVAIVIGIFALIVIGGSFKVGIGLGPRTVRRPGFFPFYIGLFVLVATIINLVQAWTADDDAGLFAEWDQLRQVSFVVVPTAIYVALIPWIGIYIASVMLIALFMRWLGRYGWGMVAAVSIGVPLATFLVFEKWFLVPLPKGPVEDWLGF